MKKKVTVDKKTAEALVKKHNIKAKKDDSVEIRIENGKTNIYKDGKRIGAQG